LLEENIIKQVRIFQVNNILCGRIKNNHQCIHLNNKFGGFS
jgi:hypothetical protein